MSPFRRHARGTDLGVAARAAAGSTNSLAHSLFEQVSSGGLYAQSLAMQASRADYVGSIHFAFQAQHGFSKREP